MNNKATPATLLQALLCDDVRIENNNKQILIGVYSDEIIVPTFPANLVLCLWMRMRFAAAMEYKLEITAVGEGDNRLLPVGTVTVRVTNEKKAVDVRIGGIPLQLHAAGRIVFQWRLQGETDWMETLQINGVQGPLPTTADIP